MISFSLNRSPGPIQSLSRNIRDMDVCHPLNREGLRLVEEVLP